MNPTVQLSLTEDLVDLLEAALDSHIYWQLSDPQYRNDGYVRGRGSNDPFACEEIEQCERLQHYLQQRRLPE